MTRKMKDSGVEWIGEIPEDVDIISNKYLFKYIKGKNPKEFNSEKRGLPYIGASDLEKDGDIHDYENYSIEELPTVEKDETLVLWDGARAGLIGIGHTGYIGSTIVKVIPRVDYVDKKYWYWYLKGFQPLLLDWVGGTTIPHMNRKFINEIKFINFPLSQQKSIADFLDKKTQEIDNIIFKTKKAIEEYKRYKQSLITETVTKGLDENVQMKDSGIEWIGEIPGHWETMRLKYQYRLHGRIGWQGLTTSDRIDYGPYLITGIDFINGKVDFTNSYCISEERWEEAYKIQVNNGDLLITKDGTIGKVAIVEGLDRKASLNSGIMLIEAISEVNKKFMYWVLLSDLFYKWFNIINVGVSTILHLYQKDFYDFAYTLPPLKEQEQIASYLDEKTNQIDQIISTKEKLLIEMEAYKKSLIYETVTGKREVK